MTQLGLPVPGGFTVTTEACREYMLGGGRLPDGLEDEIQEHVRTLEHKAEKGFGDPQDPLLLSVRSGAAVSMPGMMDTILNLGLNDEAVGGLAESTANPRFAYDSYRRLIQMYGEVVEGIAARHFEVEVDRLVLEADLVALVHAFKRVFEQRAGFAFPQDPRDQLMRAVRAVFESWDNPRARVYRALNGIPDDLGTAVNVVQMVFGNKGASSGTGVAFTRDPSTGARCAYGEFLLDAQ